MLVLDIVTLFPSMFFGPLGDGMLARARRNGAVAVRLHDLRRWGVGRHRQVDDTPFGGGGGMILRPEPLFEAVEWIRDRYPAEGEKVILLSPQGRKLDHDEARRLAGFDRLIFLCGRYEGVDERVRENLADEELSIGDFVLTGGELPAMVAAEAISRFIPGVLGQSAAAEQESFADGRLESPYYTRPAEFRGHGVPSVLLSGNHGAIEKWREDQATEVTRNKRPDLLQRDGSTSAASRRRGEEKDERHQ
jgi:tRNA (guanine37-N1)-methyltransferase